MTSEIRLERSTLEHMLKQPSGRRYALFCDAVIRGVLEGSCDSQNKLGHIGDYSDYLSAKDGALAHPHAACIRFYPDNETSNPSQDFLADLQKALKHINNPVTQDNLPKRRKIFNV